MKILVMAGLAALAVPASAHAQAKGAETALDVATCVVDNEPDEARALLATLPGSASEAEANRQLAELFQACAEGLGATEYDFADARPALAATLTARHIASGRHLAALDPASPWYASAIAGRTAGTDYDPVVLGRHEFGTCVAAAAPDASAKLVASAPGSADEKAAIGALKPALPGCITQGQSIKLTPASLRLMLAEPLYHAISG